MAPVKKKRITQKCRLLKYECNIEKIAVLILMTYLSLGALKKVSYVFYFIFLLETVSLALKDLTGKGREKDLTF